MKELDKLRAENERLKSDMSFVEKNLRDAMAELAASRQQYDALIAQLSEEQRLRDEAVTKLAAAQLEACAWKRQLEQSGYIDGNPITNARIAALEAELAAAWEDTARRCAEIADDETRNKVCLTCGLLVMSAIHREFGIDAARKGGAE